MKKLITMLICITGLFLFVGCGEEMPVVHSINPDIVQSEAFSLTAEKAGLATSAKGSIFLQDSEEGKSILLTASIEIDEKDGYGISFYFGEGWKIAEIYSDYPQSDDLSYEMQDYSTVSIYSKADVLNTGTNPSERVAVWFTADADSEWKQRAEIKAAGGGSGSIIIKLLPESTKAADLNMLLTMGSAEESGRRIVETDGLEVQMKIPD